MWWNIGRLLHVLKASDIADGMQCVVRISGVAALAVLVSRTTICAQRHQEH